MHGFDLSNTIEAIVMLAIGIGLIWLSVVSRRHGDKTWWGWLITLPIVLYLAFSAAIGAPVGGHR